MRQRADWLDAALRLRPEPQQARLQRAGPELEVSSVELNSRPAAWPGPRARAGGRGAWAGRLCGWSNIGGFGGNEVGPDAEGFGSPALALHYGYGKRRLV